MLGFIHINRGRSDQSEFECRCIFKQRLYGRARVTVRGNSPVKGQIHRLLAVTALHGSDRTGVVIDDDHRGIRLFGIVCDLVRIGLEQIPVGKGFIEDSLGLRL